MRTWKDGVERQITVWPDRHVCQQTSEPGWGSWPPPLRFSPSCLLAAEGRPHAPELLLKVANHVEPPLTVRRLAGYTRRVTFLSPCSSSARLRIHSLGQAGYWPAAVLRPRRERHVSTSENTIVKGIKKKKKFLREHRETFQWWIEQGFPQV